MKGYKDSGVISVRNMISVGKECYLKPLNLRKVFEYDLYFIISCISSLAAFYCAALCCE